MFVDGDQIVPLQQLQDHLKDLQEPTDEQSRVVRGLTQSAVFGKARNSEYTLSKATTYKRNRDAKLDTISII